MSPNHFYMYLESICQLNKLINVSLTFNFDKIQYQQPQTYQCILNPSLPFHDHFKQYKAFVSSV